MTGDSRPRTGAIVYRRAGAADAEQIALLHAESWRRTYRGTYRDEYLDGDVFGDRARAWRERLAAPPEEQFALLAEQDGAISGFACVIGGHDARWGSLLDNLHVRHEMKSRGIGRELMRASAAWTIDHHPGGLYLWVLESNIEAQGFYERLGGVQQGSELFEPPGGGTANGLRYWWPDPRALVGDR